MKMFMVVRNCFHLICHTSYWPLQTLQRTSMQCNLTKATDIADQSEDNYDLELTNEDEF